MKKAIPQYKPVKCECCRQTTTYASKLNKGLVDALINIAVAIQIKGKNDIIPGDLAVSTKDPMWSTPSIRRQHGMITHSQYNNLSHLRCHGLVALLDVKNYCLTKKGAAFLRGEEVEAVAVIEKATHSNIGYIADAEGVTFKTTIRQIFRNKEGYWDGWDYEIVNGELIHKNNQTEQGSLL